MTALDRGGAETMEITFLGHAGWCIETGEAVVIMDPWLSPSGAFDSAWFQFPPNQHLAALVQEKLGDSRKQRFLYVSHEHKDHFDRPFLASIECRDFTVVIPRFRRAHLESAFAGYACKEVIACADGDEVAIPGGYLRLYLDDAELNRDSAVLVRADGATFLNLNDCRIHDALPGIARAEGVIDVFTCQFSGAGWHPTCYSYSRERYESIAAKKVSSKFVNVSQAIRTLKPRVFVPSAGPPCFLDPRLFHLNFEPINIFPRAPQLVEFLDRRLKGSATTRWAEVMPGDRVDAHAGDVVHRVKERVTDENYDDVLRRYAGRYEDFFHERERRGATPTAPTNVARALREALLQKVVALTLHERVMVPLYFELEDLIGHPDRMMRVDFPNRTVEFVPAVQDEQHYIISARSCDVGRVLDGRITWDDFSLSFRMRLNREPDVYQTLLQGFLRLEAEDMNRFCSKLLDIESNQERIVVEAGGKRYSINRYCPHQGGDLSRAWIEDERFLTCPRHHWRFDLEREGTACENEGTIHAVCLDDED